MNKARYEEWEKVTSTRTMPHDSRLRQVSRVFLALLLLSSVIVILGCGDDDDSDAGIPVDARISNPNSVFRLFDQAGTDGFTFTNGLFSPTTPSTSPTRLSFFNVNFQRVPPVSRFSTTPSNPAESEGEGDSDGGASCNYLYDSTTNRIPCTLCDFVCTADNIEPGTEGLGECFLQLDLEDTPETRENPRFQSTSFEARIGLDNDGNVVTVNGVPVVAEP